MADENVNTYKLMALQKCLCVTCFSTKIVLCVQIYIHDEKNIFRDLLYVYVCVLPACMFVYHVCVWYLQKSEESIRSGESGVIDLCELLYGCCESNLRPLQEQVFLTTKAISPTPIFVT